MPETFTDSFAVEISNRKTLEKRAVAKLKDLFCQASSVRSGFDILATTIGGREWSAYVFGGTIRDLFACRNPQPRDVDIVVADVSLEDLRSAFRGHVIRATRFGGLHLEIGSLPVDIWPLESTWAFRAGYVPGRSFEDLPRTTFLNVEAIAVQFPLDPRQELRVHSTVFFDALETRVLEINLEENPFPVSCIARSLVMAHRLQYSIGPRLCNYIMQYRNKLELEELERAQLAHYGQMRLSRDVLVRSFEAIEASEGGREGVRLPL